MAQRKRNPGAIRDLESIVNPVTGDITTTGNITANNVTVCGALTVEDSITMAGTQIRHPVQFGPYSPTASSVQLITSIASWANEVSLSTINLSLNGPGAPMLQLWTLTGVVTAGYFGGVARENDAAAVEAENFSNGFKMAPSLGSGFALHVGVTLRRHGTVTSNTWHYTVLGGRTDEAGALNGGGYVVLPGALVGLSVNTATGTRVYDNGEISGFYRY